MKTYNKAPYFTISGKGTAPLPFDYEEFRQYAISETMQKWCLRNHFTMPSMAERYRLMAGYYRSHKGIIKLDIHKFYPSIHYGVLLRQVYMYLYAIRLPQKRLALEELYHYSVRHISSDPLCVYFRSLVEGFNEHNLVRDYGLPVDHQLSHFLSFVMLFSLEYELVQRGINYVRHIDDWLIFTKDVSKAEAVYRDVVKPHLERLCLAANPSSLQIGDRRQHYSWCGYEYRGGFIGVSKEKIAAFKERIRELCRVPKVGNGWYALRDTEMGQAAIRQQIEVLNHKIDGFWGYYHMCLGIEDRRYLDCYIREQFRHWLLTGAKGVGSVHVALSNAELSALGLKSFQVLYKNRKASAMGGKGPGLVEGNV